MARSRKYSPEEKAEMRKRGRISWHLKRPDKGPATLAIKNRECTDSSSTVSPSDSVQR